jgi:hypothetical protein
MPVFTGLRFNSVTLPVALMAAIGCGEFAPAADGRMMAAERCAPALLFATAKTETKTRTDDAAEKSRTRKRAVVWSALFLVAGIAVLGVFLIVVVLLWGIRLRRRNRTRKPPPAPFDPLWYLRKGTTAESSPPPADDADPKPGETQ